MTKGLAALLVRANAGSRSMGIKAGGILKTPSGNSERSRMSQAFLWHGQASLNRLCNGSEGLKPLDQWFTVLDDLLKNRRKRFPSEIIESQVTCSMMRALALRRPAHVNIEKWADRALVIARKQKRTSLSRSRSWSTSRLIATAALNCRKSKSFYTLKGLMKSQNLPPLTRLVVHWVKAAYCNMASMYPECLKVVSDGLTLANAAGIHIMDYMLMGQGVMSLLKTKDFATARGYLKKMAYSLSSAKPWEASFYHYVSAWEALYCDNISLASFHSEQAEKLCKVVGNPWTLSMSYLQRAVVAHDSGDSRKAVSYLDRAFAIGRRSKNDYIDFACALLRAFFVLRNGDSESAMNFLRQGLLLGQRKGFINLYMWDAGHYGNSVGIRT